MKRSAPVAGTIEIASGMCVLKLQNLSADIPFTKPSSSSNDTAVPNVKKMLEDVREGKTLAHSTKQNLSKRQVSIYINHLQRGAGLVRGEMMGGWNTMLDQKLREWFLKEQKGTKKQTLAIEDMKETFANEQKNNTRKPTLAIEDSKDMKGTSDPKEDGKKAVAVEDHPDNDTEGPDNVDDKKLEKNKQASSTDSSDSDSSSTSSPEVPRPRINVHEWESDWQDQWHMALTLEHSIDEGNHKKRRIMKKILCALAKYKEQWDNAS